MVSPIASSPISVGSARPSGGLAVQGSTPNMRTATPEHPIEPPRPDIDIDMINDTIMDHNYQAISDSLMNRNDIKHDIRMAQTEPKMDDHGMAETYQAKWASDMMNLYQKTYQENTGTGEVSHSVENYEEKVDGDLHLDELYGITTDETKFETYDEVMTKLDAQPTLYDPKNYPLENPSLPSRNDIMNGAIEKIGGSIDISI